MPKAKGKAKTRPTETGRRVKLSIDAALHRALKLAALFEQRSVKDVAEELARAFVARVEPKIGGPLDTEHARHQRVLESLRR